MPHRRAAGHTQSRWLRLVHVQASKDGQAKPYFASAFFSFPPSLSTQALGVPSISSDLLLQQET